MARPTTLVDLAEVTSPRIQRRSDIAPERIKDLLPSMMIVDVDRDPLRFRYRLVGTRVVEAERWGGASSHGCH